METALKQRINRTLSAANTVDGTGEVVSVVWNSAQTQGVAIRESQRGLDTVHFTYSAPNTLRFLGKQRALLP